MSYKKKGLHSQKIFENKGTKTIHHNLLKSF